jgi:hypothetical protein
VAQVAQESGGNFSSVPDDELDEKITQPVPPPPVPMAAFPETIQKVIINALDAFGTPEQIPVAAFLAFLSALVGGSRGLQVKRSYVAYGNTWIATVGSSGTGKTPCARAFFKHIDAIEATYYEAYKTDMADYERQEVDFTYRRDEYKKNKCKGQYPEKPHKPALKQICLDDTTVEALGGVLLDNPKGISRTIDELAGSLFDLDKYTQGKGGGHKSRMLSAYDGQSWKVTRKGEKGTIRIPRAFLSVFGGIQPGILCKAFESITDEASGFIQRFIFIRAERDKPAFWNDAALTEESEETLRIIAERLAKMDIAVDINPVTMKETESTPAIDLTREALSVYISWFDDIALHGYNSNIDPIIEKLKDKCLRLCLLLHLLDAALNNASEFEPVTADCMQRAIMLANWTHEHFIQCQALIKNEKLQQESPVKTAIKEIIITHGADILSKGGLVTTAELTRLVEEKLGVTDLSHRTIGNAAKSLSLTPAKKGGGVRAWMLTQNLISTLKPCVTCATCAQSLQPQQEPVVAQKKPCVTCATIPADQMPEPSPGAPERPDTRTQPGDEDDGIII